MYGHQESCCNYYEASRISETKFAGIVDPVQTAPRGDPKT